MSVADDKAPPAYDQSVNLAGLRAQLKQAAAIEDFELAASLKAQIKEEESKAEEAARQEAATRLQHVKVIKICVGDSKFRVNSEIFINQPPFLDDNGLPSFKLGQDVLTQLSKGQKLVDDADVYIDRSGEYFSHIIAYLRSCRDNTPFLAPPDLRARQLLKVEAHFFGLAQLSKLLIDMKEDGVLLGRGENLRNAGQTAKDLLYVGCSSKEIMEAGFTLAECTGYPPEEILSLFGVKGLVAEKQWKLLQAAGVSGSAVRDAGASASEVWAAGAYHNGSPHANDWATENGWE